MAQTKQQKQFAALAKQSSLTTEFNNAWAEFREEPSVAAANDVIAKAKDVLHQSKVTGKQMVPESNIKHRQYIAEDYLDNPPVETKNTHRYLTGPETTYKNVTDPKTGKTVFAKVTKFSFG